MNIFLPLGENEYIVATINLYRKVNRTELISSFLSDFIIDSTSNISDKDIIRDYILTLTNTNLYLQSISNNCKVIKTSRIPLSNIESVLVKKHNNKEYLRITLNNHKNLIFIHPNMQRKSEISHLVKNSLFKQTF